MPITGTAAFFRFTPVTLPLCWRKVLAFCRQLNPTNALDRGASETSLFAFLVKNFKTRHPGILQMFLPLAF